eukprot:scpid66556/ scgid12037/ N-acetylglucosaminyl-phosphatidylinositol biosynthetic protein; GlcNAc-PI synthesis protein; Phosphatidylinositol-glycan biosynthesis class A protein
MVTFFPWVVRVFPFSISVSTTVQCCCVMMALPCFLVVTIVVVSRLVYRKGMDLLAGILPIICNRHGDVHFLIGGDGPKRVNLEEICEKHQLHARMHLLGSIAHADVRNVLVQGDIFLNTSLTEAFCMAIVEAASCGLKVVSTDVGGIPEVLPTDMIQLAEPSVDGLVTELEVAISNVRQGKGISPEQAHARIEQYYQWSEVAERTEKVYDLVSEDTPICLADRLHKFYSLGPVAGKVFSLLLMLCCVWLMFVEWWRPSQFIDQAPDLGGCRESLHQQYHTPDTGTSSKHQLENKTAPNSARKRN